MGLLLCVAFLLGTTLCLGQERPEWGDVYKVKGVLYLPYAEIREPFTGYFDASQNLSRIDYYRGMVQTIQVAPDAEEGRSETPYGANYKIAYMPDKETWQPRRTCFLVNGTVNNTVPLQAVLPDVASFEFVRQESCWEGTTAVDEPAERASCERFQLVVTNENRVSKYTLWVSRDGQGRAVPRRYLMMGYNTLLGSHFDKYELIYHGFSRKPLPSSVFDITHLINETCRRFPGPGAEHLALHSPMAEFMNGHDAHMHSAFDKFREDHSRDYGHHTEHERRRDIFRQNLRFIHSTNRANRGYTVKVNHLADRSSDELGYLRGRLQSRAPTNALPFPKDRFSSDLPDYVDWRLYGAVTPVKDQAVCGSCWSFGTVGELEAALFRKTGKLTRLSEQQLVDCSWNQGNNGCDGGEDFRAYEYIRAHGLATDEDYGAYLGQDGICHDTKVNATVTTIKNYINVTDKESLQKALANVGPVSVSIDAAVKAFTFYSNGVFYDPKCRNDTDGLDHAVLAVGYGTLQGEPYWLIKNSWSTYWGNDGYVLISQKDNNCGVASQGTYVEL
ncbi:digestive cysteine proteinase 2 [Ixodes scapularis]|uniref:digestive cysteine proteinase 2 n=1 Tax=Ixodes scapularis TaxID=6945 RepID=UPI001C38EF08|nr:digestive cysteine proteinase 2 [Ixodes scapularis]